MDTILFDAIDQSNVEKTQAKRDQIGRPRNGDYVRFQTGELERISNDMGSKMQTSPLWAGSFFLLSCGASFSGGLNPPIPLDTLELTEETQDGKFWVFHHNQAGANRGVSFNIPCRVYATTAEYKGYITRGI